jgi:sugar phosphate isomerase/epimerase
MKTRLGLGSYAFTWGLGVPGHSPPDPLSAMDLVAESQRLGVGILQICDNLPLTSLNEAQLEALAREARARRIAIEVGTRGLDAANLLAHLNVAARFEATMLRVVLARDGMDPSPEEAASRLRELLPEFARWGVRLAIENHDGIPSGGLAWIIEQLGPDRVGICLDTVNSFGALEGPEVVVDRLGRFTCCVHVKDFTIRRVDHQMGFIIEGCPAGSGQLDVPWLLERLKRDAPGPLPAILEVWVPPGPTLAETIERERAWREASIRYLRGLIPD